VVGLIAPTEGRWSYTLAAARHVSSPDAPDDAALLRGLRHVAGSERAKDVAPRQHLDGISHVEFGPSRPDLGLFVPGSVAPSFIGAMLPRLTADDLGPASGIRVFFWKQGPFARPLFRLPREATFAHVAMLRTPTTDPSLVARMLAGNRTLFEHSRDLGGTLYPFAALELSGREWQQHYGPVWPALARAKRRYDPDLVLASGPNPLRATGPQN
jgi:cytokinin dehydrogenase